ncbi:MAG: hypothetical protein JST39_01175 [Bacteroidetes bacterium]|nr:hypothetical protein [Bacteroidota bacterium]
MPKAIFFIFGGFILSFLSSCSPAKDVAGRYRSNFAVHGFLGTVINLNKDSSFGYRMRGDLIFDTSNGYYKLKDGYVILYHEPFKPDTSLYKIYGKESVLLTYALSYHHPAGPEKYLASHKKLFVCDSTGKVIKKQFGYSKRRQFLVFGKHWYKRRYYLQRVASAEEHQ